MMTISIICVYNNSEIYSNQLFSSLQKQDVDYELIAIDNRKNSYTSASSALNYASSISKGEILVYIHQDIILKTSDCIRIFANAIDSCEIGTIVGTQGVIEKSKEYYQNLTAGKDIDLYIQNRYPMRLIEVSCVDEGMFGVKRDTFINHPFNEDICNGWHLYAVEQCLFARMKKSKVYVMPIELHHSSYGRITLSYMLSLKRLCALYRKNFKYIWTTCYKVYTNSFYINSLVVVWIVHRLITRKSLE